MANDLWRTPPEVYAYFNREYSYGVDLAADVNNAKCPVFLDEAANSLSVDWAALMGMVGTKWGWLNPPYSNPLPWVDHALVCQKNGKGLTMLLNADCSVRWFARSLRGATKIVQFIADEEDGQYTIGRIGFLNGEGKPGNQNNKPQFLIEFDPNSTGLVTEYLPLRHVMREGTKLL